MAIDAKNLCLEIDRAFDLAPYPGDENIVEGGGAMDIERERIKNKLKGCHWRRVSFETLLDLRSALPLLTPHAYRFYLPAFMIFSAADFYRADIIPYEVVLTLTPPYISDVERIRNTAKLYPELQPFSVSNWEEILNTLTAAHHSEAPMRIFLERVHGLEMNQRSTIHNFLEHLRDSYGNEFSTGEVDNAIQRYWHAY